MPLQTNQVTVLTEMIQEGFTKEALVLLRAYTQDDSNEKVAFPQDAAGMVQMLILGAIPLYVIGKLVDKVAKKAFPDADLRGALRGISGKISTIFITISAVLAPLVLYFLAKAAFRDPKNYETMVDDNLAGLKHQINSMMRKA